MHSEPWRVVGSIVVNGDISPGATPDFNDAPGRLSSDGDVTFLVGSTFSVQVNGTSLGQTYDQLAVDGVPQAITVIAVDSLGNAVSDHVGTVHFLATDLQGALPADYTFTSGDFGQHTFSATFAAAGPQTLSVTDAASGLAGVSKYRWA